MKSIIIGFSRPHTSKIFADAIMWYTDKSFSHVYIKTDNMIFQASNLRTNYMGEVYFNKINKIVEQYEFKISEDLYNKIISYCQENEGTPYGMTQILGIIISDLLKLNKNILADGKDSMICSELAAVIIEEFLGFSIDKKNDIIKPHELLEILRTSFPNNIVK